MLAPTVYIKYLYQYACHYMAGSYGMYPTNTPDKFYVNWRKAIRRMFNLRYRTYSCLLHLIFNDLPVDGQIQLRIITFLNCMYTKKNNVMSLCGRLAANGSGSPVSNSVNFVCYKYKIGKSDLPHLSPQCLKQVVHSHHRAMDNLANKLKAIFITNILNGMQFF